MVHCPKCNRSLIADEINTDSFVACHSCGSKTRTDLFPAAIKLPDAGSKAEGLIVDNEAGCFYHPGKKAVIHCNSCGRFLCSLCDVDMGTEHLCFSCLETGKKKTKRLDLETHRVLYDSLALGLALYPILFIITIYFTFLTAPASLFISIWHYKKPSSIIPRSKIRFYIAGILSILQIVGWVVIIQALMKMNLKKPS